MGGYPLPKDTEEFHVADSLRESSGRALESLYRSYAPALRDYCRHYLKDPHEAEDVCHETILKAAAAGGRFRPGAKVWPWLVAIASNLCRDLKRERGQLLPLGGQSDRSTEETEERVARRLRVGITKEALSSLPERYRLHIVLKDYDGWSYQEIARFHGSTEGSVKSTLMRARRALAQEVRQIAERRGQWPLPALIPLGWGRMRASVGGWLHCLRVRLGYAGGDGSLLVPVLSNVAAAMLVFTTVFTPIGEASAEEPAVVKAGTQTSVIDPSQGTIPTPRANKASSGSSAAAELPNDTGTKKVQTPAVLASVNHRDGTDSSGVIVPPVGVDCRGDEERGPVLATICAQVPDG